MKAKRLIVGDWGTSSLRLYWLDGDGCCVGKKEGPGVSKVTRSIPEVFFELCQDWLSAYPDTRVILSGMVGSDLGWHLANRLSCPIDLRELPSKALRFSEQSLEIEILPGLSCINPMGGFDVIRGEETQLLGVLQSFPELLRGRRLFCLPGTHSKWVEIVEGQVQHFFTMPVGELYDLMTQKSTLCTQPAEINISLSNAFDTGLSLSGKGHSLMMNLFQTRSRHINGELTVTQQPEFMSGMLIGDEITAAMQQLHNTDSIHVIANEKLCRAYCHAFKVLGFQAISLDGSAAVLAGLKYASMHFERDMVS